MAIRAKKTVLGGAFLVALGGVAVAGMVVTMPPGIDTPGEVLAELQGHTDTAGYATAERAPRGDVPGWSRAAGTDVTVVRPGAASGDDGGSVRVDLDLPGATPPADCTELPRVGMPFDGGGDWPDLGEGPALLCDGWVTVVLDDRLYAWTDDALRSET
ncbi:hypothetical protein DQ244_07465 [Blastococcus sp. TBT05-19]|uniref:hypothetical protein n=1 Tax=Blastococcus sp. TBT05-19 TaxID=2250581 RepID=UPI000DE9ED4E|nr:hypothetical protein [Blastococcus sp. TBT05-19]RBY92133.1 hypothetical protein DQ244_07465 [Blastococcus sp. TBT05-19]